MSALLLWIAAALAGVYLLGVAAAFARGMYLLRAGGPVLAPAVLWAALHWPVDLFDSFD